MIEIGESGRVVIGVLLLLWLIIYDRWFLLLIAGRVTRHLWTWFLTCCNHRGRVRLDFLFLLFFQFVLLLIFNLLLFLSLILIFRFLKFLVVLWYTGVVHLLG